MTKEGILDLEADIIDIKRDMLEDNADKEALKQGLGKS